MNPINNNSPFNGPLTPHTFRQNQNANSEKSPVEEKKSSPIKYAPIVIAGLALLILPITVWQINTQQDIRQRASEIQPTQQSAIARIGDDLITDTDVDLEYTKQQNATTYTATPTSLKQKILDDIIKKKLIEAEALARNITVTDEEIDLKISLLNDLGSQLSSNREIVKSLVLEEKVGIEISDSVVAIITFSNSITPQAKSFFETIRTKALTTNNLLAASIPYTKQSRDIYVSENAIIQSNHIFSLQTTELILNLEPKDISEVMEDNNKLFIVEVIEKNSREYSTLDEFIQIKRNTDVQIL